MLNVIVTTYMQLNKLVIRAHAIYYVYYYKYFTIQTYCWSANILCWQPKELNTKLQIILQLQCREITEDT